MVAFGFRGHVSHRYPAPLPTPIHAFAPVQRARMLIARSPAQDHRSVRQPRPAAPLARAPWWSASPGLCKPSVGSAAADPFYYMLRAGPPLFRWHVLRREGPVQRPSSIIPRPWCPCSTCVLRRRRRRRRGRSGQKPRSARAAGPRRPRRTGSPPGHAEGSPE